MIPKFEKPTDPALVLQKLKAIQPWQYVPFGVSYRSGGTILSKVPKDIASHRLWWDVRIRVQMLRESNRIMVFEYRYLDEHNQTVIVGVAQGIDPKVKMRFEKFIETQLSDKRFLSRCVTDLVNKSQTKKGDGHGRPHCDTYAGSRSAAAIARTAVAAL